jgi:proteasome lid subunit RPN8/RPN11
MIQPTHKPIAAGSGARQIGTLWPGSPPVFVYDGVLASVIGHSESDLRRELGGFLLGGLHQDRQVYVEVRAFLPAAATGSRASSLTFTHDTWAEMTRRAEADYPGELVLGWQHTHPGLGVFLSAYDLFIHRHFFSQPWQIAMVVDPRARQFSFFQWHDGSVVDCGFVWIPGNREPRPMEIL